MEHIILKGQTTTRFVFDITILQEYLCKLTDTRKARGKIYPLSVVLTLMTLAKLAGEDKPSGITDWIRLRRDMFVKAFNLKHNRMPCLNTIREIGQNIVSVAELQKLFKQFLHETYGGQQSKLVTLDGKTMRGTIPKGETRGVHLVAVYLPEEGITLAQVVVPEKKNEISAAPELLEGIDLKNRVVCADAMQTQRKLSVKILGKGGDYIWFLKDNQPTLRSDVEQFFTPPRVSAGWNPPKLVETSAEQSDKGHGRLEKRKLTRIIDDQAYLDWPGLRQVFKLERSVEIIKSGKTYTETVYGISSCDPEKVSAKQLLEWTRSYWGIENGLHYRRDVTLREDATRISSRTFAEVIATLNNFVIGLTQKLGFTNLASARRNFNAQIAAVFARFS